MALLSMLSLPLTLLYPLPLKIAVDTVLGKQPLPVFLTSLQAGANRTVAIEFAVAILLGIAVLVNLQSLLSWWLQTYVGEKLVWDFRAKLLKQARLYASVGNIGNVVKNGGALSEDNGR